MLSCVQSAGLCGIEAYGVTVEVDIAPQGLPGWHFVGLPEAVVKESKDRVSSALRNSGFQLRNRKTTINLAPARRKKTGNYFDLPIAMGLLIATQQLAASATAGHLFAGELLLSGDLHPIPGALSLALFAREHDLILVLPAAQASEIAPVRGLRFLAATSLTHIMQCFAASHTAPHTNGALPKISGTSPDLQDVRGQPLARRALEIAAAGGHHLMMMGPPGTGKTMLAERLPGLLPPLTHDEAIATTQIYSAAGESAPGQVIVQRPFRAPHHGASAVGLAGGGSPPTIGEISLAHNGVLFLDELPEFHRDAIELLRQPLELGYITITRTGHRVRFPAHFQLIAACNPCRCGYLAHPTISCQCSIHQIQTYRAKISGPLLNRIDLHVIVGPVATSHLLGTAPEENSATVRARVLAARARQALRYQHPSRCNAHLNAAQTRVHCAVPADAKKLLTRALDQHTISPRALDRLLRISRTIADLAASESITAAHVAEALQYRALDRPL